ncbi:hypothetical protein FB472_1179 [Rhodoglobus vestalii]|uniref:Uncharacterized protein n=1 Tax=Rhodoglobus vestalii TaxID=193384 RepID=A0A8H2PTR8_9MICO|nr:hypothetical protein [Rhodoglobus vestalii]TQO19611.1 hypothetical protein FB472_1179 [Rhodoglobus vestalii]
MRSLLPTLVLAVLLGITACSSPGESSPADQSGASAEPSETEPEITYEQDIAAAIAERPTVGSPEYTELVDSYRINSSEHKTSEDAVLAFGRTLVQDWFGAGHDEVPKNFYDQALALSIDEKVEKMEPDYWSEVFCEALFGTDRASLTNEQQGVFDAILRDQRMFLAQRILTASEDNPTKLAVLSDSVEFDINLARYLNGRYNFTFWPNEDNTLTNVNDNQIENKPRENSIGFTIRLDPETDSWIYGAKDL